HVLFAEVHPANVSDGVAPSATPHREEGAQGVAPSDKTAAAGADPEADALARQILELARCEVVARNPFLASSLSLLTPVAGHGSSSLFRVDGRSLSYDVERVMGDFVEHRRAPTHDLVHALAHCLLLHPFVGGSLRRRHWDLAADIAAEAVVAELMGPRDGLRGSREQAAFDQLGAVLAGRLGAERIYRALGEGRFENDVEQWERLFVSDDHGSWYPEPQDAPADDGKGDEGAPRQGERSGRTSNPDEGEGPSEGPGAARDDDQARDLPEAYDGAPHDGPPPASGDARAACEDACAQERWAKAAKSLRVDLETLSRSYGSQAQGLVRELAVSTHEQVDYREFLRQFAVSSEEMHLSDSEFDYVFYTYGLQLYGDTPLIEPLEFRDEKRIRDFAIVIDTSSSVTATVVQQFVDATFDVLTSASSFFERTNIHIIQADARVQGDTKISSLADLDRWRRSIRLKGFGGTDFRPAFRYVRELRERGEFDDFQGLIYFTDGWGIYPEQMPPYKTTFVFYDEDHRPELVPAWALQITLHPGEFESMSVY
ncbi:vWA domain-containing protein, partial [Olsenella massiliensis]|uniref:vWA domain-containing protein n=1 Tax=Olsenella massiliensis TaxID=1622075 RepID=UPI001F20D626